MSQGETFTAANDNMPLSESGKGDIYDAINEMDVAPEIQDQLDATESFMEKIFGISLGKLDPGARVKILDMRRNPEDYIDTEALTMLERVKTIVPSTDINVNSKKAA